MNAKKTTKKPDKVQLKLFLTRAEHKILKIAAALDDQAIGSYIHEAVMTKARKETKDILK